MSRHRRIQSAYAAVCGAMALVGVLGRDDRPRVACTATGAPRWPGLDMATHLLARGCAPNAFADLIPGVVVRTHGALSGEALADLLAHVPPPQPARGTEPTFRDTLSAWLTTRLGDAVRSGAYWTVSWSGPGADDALTLMCLLNRRAAQTGLLFHCARADTFSMPEGTRVQVFAPTPVASLPPELRRVIEAPAGMARALRGRG